MHKPIRNTQMKQIATAEAIRVLMEAKEKLRDRLTDTSTLGNRIAAQFDDTDEQQNAYNLTLDGIIGQFDAIIEKQCVKLLKIGRF